MNYAISIQKFISLCFFFLALGVLSRNSADADLVTFNLTTSAPDASGDELSEFQTVTVDGVTLNVITGSSIPGSDQGARFNANSSTGGVDTIGVTGSGGDSPSALDVAETLTFEFNFSNTLEVSLVSIDLQGVGAAENQDQAFLNIEETQIALGSGVDGFNGTTDNFTFPNPVSLTSGDFINLTAEDQIGVQSIQLQVISPIPEPACSLVISLTAMTALLLRRRF